MTAFGTYGVELIVEAAFGYAPYSGVSWTDISKYVHRIVIRRGAESTPIPRTVAGQCTLELNNDDGRFDPNNTAGTYYPDVILTVPIRIRATWDSTTYPIYSGFANSWDVAYPYKGSRSIVTVPCADGFQLLNQYLIPASATYAEQRTDVRIAAVLDDVAWPSGLRDLDTGVENVEAFTAGDAETSALNHLTSVANAEVGRIFISGDGSFTFHNRTHHAGGATSKGTFGPSDLPYVDVAPSYDDNHLYNDIRVTRTAGETQTATDATSITAYRQRTLEQGGIMVNDAAAMSVAEWQLDMFKDMAARIDTITINPQASPTALWPVILGVDLRDAIVVKVVPRSGADSLNQQVSIEYIKHDIGVDRWLTTYGCYPLSTFAVGDYWIVGTSELDTETAIA